MKKQLFRSQCITSKHIFNILTLTLLCINLLIANNGKAQKYKNANEVFISIEAGKFTVKKVLKSIEDKTDFVFLYDANDIDDNVSLDIPGKSLSVAGILQIISENTPLRFRQVNNNIDVRRVKNPQESTSVSQQRTITGTITDENGQPLPGANILVKGTAIGAVTDFDGNYSIQAPDTATILVFSYVGYLTKEETIAGRSIINHEFTPDASTLDAVVVVGYGTQRKKDITGSVSTVEDYRLENVPNTNFSQALQGSVSGLYITNNSAGAEQSDVSIRIRGQNSIEANNEPLIILDGVPFSGNLSQINPNDIESIDVLKDVSSAAIYGSRGANGVILITTKKGKNGVTTISYNTYVGFQQPTNVPDLMNGQEYYDFKLERLGGDPNDPSAIFSPTELTNFNAANFTDWIDVSTRTSIQQEHQLSVTSGTENTKVYVSGTFIDVQGIALGDQFQRYNLQMNLDQKIGEHLKIGTNTRLNYIDRSGVAVDLTGSFFLNPLTNPFEEDGSIAVYPWPEDQFFGNPLGNSLIENEDEEYSIFSNIYVDVDLPFIPGLSYRFNTGIEYSNRDINTYVGRDNKTGLEASGISTNRQNRTRSFLIENILNYKTSFGLHNIDVTALYSSQVEDFQRLELEARDFPSDVLTFYQAELANRLTPSNVFRESTLLSQMGRINYGYDSKYLLTLTARRDGYSGFGANDKYGFFPSAAIAWNIAREGFLSNSEVISNLKLRASYGQIGNQAVRPFRTLAQFGVQNYLGGGEGNVLAPGFIPETLGDPSLGWETTTSANFAVDYGFFDGRIRGSVEYYLSKTEDLLLNRRISSVQGITNILQNVGETKNWGLEVLLSANIIQKDNFQWSADLNFSLNRNEVVNIFGVDDRDDIGSGLFIGEPINVNYGFVFDGIWQEDEADEALIYNAVPGDVRVKDVNEDGVISRDDDREIFGNRQPDFIAGLGSTFTYKNWSLNFFIYTEQGVERPNLLLDSDETIFLIGARRNGVQRQWWTPENNIDTYPRNSENSNPFSVKFLEDASFIRMRDVTLSYTFPADALKSFGLNNFRLYGTVRNLFTITDWTGTDPEFQGTDPNNEVNRQFGIPLNRTFIFGINVTL